MANERCGHGVPLEDRCQQCVNQEASRQVEIKELEKIYRQPSRRKK